MNEEHEKIWKNKKWSREARQLIEGLQKLPKGARVILLLRHSHREQIVNEAQMSKLGLTKQGKEIARLFGKNLPKDRSIQLYHSIAVRCEETAKCILEGFKEIGGQGVLKGPFEELYYIDGNKDYIVDQIFNNSEQNLINRWAAGHFNPEEFEPLIPYSKKKQSGS